MKKIIMLGLCVMICSSQGLAAQVCKTSITATTPTTDFIDNADGTITHTTTGLMWKQCSEGLSGATCTTGGAATTHTWQTALLGAETLNNGVGFAGFNDWRLPNIKELASIIEQQCSTPAINAAVFPASIPSGYWSSSLHIGNFARNVLFFNGKDGASVKSNNNYVRLVRGGQ